MIHLLLDDEFDFQYILKYNSNLLLNLDKVDDCKDTEVMKKLIIN